MACVEELHIQQMIKEVNPVPLDFLCTPLLLNPIRNLFSPPAYRTTALSFPATIGVLPTPSTRVSGGRRLLESLLNSASLLHSEGQQKF